MRKYLLDNIYLHSDSRDPLTININKYYIHTHPVVSMNRSNYKRHNKTASIEFEGSQEDSILYSGGRYGTKYKTRKTKLIEDILIIGSIFTGWNWGLTSRRKYNYYPLQPISNLSQLHISETCEVESHFKSALNRLLDKNWQIQYENGFHLRMLFNQANINHMESRFLSNMIIWEWLYPHEKNPNGATPKDESLDLKKIISYILTKHWPAQYKRQDKNNIFHALRNQLAHSGTLPINRPHKYVDNWMKQIPWDDPNGTDLQSYLKFFNILTQVVVLKTIDINADYLIQSQLNNYLSKGSID
ncbi:TPA: hypothetical protein OUZ74_002873 [Legionella pneumophila]|nr:hypothetical protein [Legionella pneumophila subsp. pneumophila]HCJ1102800.1 hypothetical protein [Legionella pneumophila]HAT8869273.1 hypothetical protein [Legionella pneumophila subsp. pneumophila]HAT8890942.1 hypothetical protein [Legionella pneumophila subsp. pneumophila]HAT9651997.1 hypothetical protein [Legionella pneumophila subsp. pneumophila]